MAYTEAQYQALEVNADFIDDIRRLEAELYDVIQCYLGRRESVDLAALFDRMMDGPLSYEDLVDQSFVEAFGYLDKAYSKLQAAVDCAEHPFIDWEKQV